MRKNSSGINLLLFISFMLIIYSMPDFQCGTYFYIHIPQKIWAKVEGFGRWVWENGKIMWKLLSLWKFLMEKDFFSTKCKYFWVTSVICPLSQYSAVLPPCFHFQLSVTAEDGSVDGGWSSFIYSVCLLLADRMLWCSVFSITIFWLKCNLLKVWMSNDLVNYFVNCHNN